MKRFILVPEAALDLSEIWEHIAEDDIDAADRFLDMLHHNIDELASTPHMGHTRKDLAEGRPILFWPVGNYLILYRVKQPLEIIAVVQGNRDIPSFLSRRGL
jgi:toxin ParE1/3/4